MGDAHILNLGFYASPERQLLFDLNDSDETHPGPFEWDVLRLATSVVLAAGSLGLAEVAAGKNLPPHCQGLCGSAVALRFHALPGDVVVTPVAFDNDDPGEGRLQLS